MDLKFDDEILMCANGAGFQSVEAMSGIYKAFCDFGIVPGNAIASSGSALFTSLFYSKGIDWILKMIADNDPSDFVDVLPYQAMKTTYGKSNRILGNTKIRKILEENMTGEATKRVKVSVTKIDDWSTHMRSATPAFTLAATSIPFIFQPVKTQGALWGDGGVFNNIPTPSLEEAKKWKRIFVFVAPEFVPFEDNSGVFGLLNLLNAVMNRELIQLEESGFFELPNVTLIQPESAFGGGLFKWSDDFALQKRCYEMIMEKLNSAEL